MKLAQAHKQLRKALINVIAANMRGVIDADALAAAKKALADTSNPEDLPKEAALLKEKGQ